MRTLRRLHLHLGCIFAPLLMFFAVTGALQMFGIKIPVLFEAHAHGYGSLPFAILPALGGLSVVVTSIVGVIMAFRGGNDRRTVWACLLFGTFVPAALLVVAHLRRGG